MTSDVAISLLATSIASGFSSRASGCACCGCRSASSMVWPSTPLVGTTHCVERPPRRLDRDHVGPEVAKKLNADRPIRKWLKLSTRMPLEEGDHGSCALMEVRRIPEIVSGSSSPVRRVKRAARGRPRGPRVTGPPGELPPFHLIRASKRRARCSSLMGHPPAVRTISRNAGSRRTEQPHECIEMEKKPARDPPRAPQHQGQDRGCCAAGRRLARHRIARLNHPEIGRPNCATRSPGAIANLSYTRDSAARALNRAGCAPIGASVSNAGLQHFAGASKGIAEPADEPAHAVHSQLQ